MSLAGNRVRGTAGIRRQAGERWQATGMASTVCAFCEVKSNMVPQWANTRAIEVHIGGGVTHSTMLQGIAVCANCGRSSMGVSTAVGNGPDAKAKMAASERFTWYPRVGQSPEFPDVPEHIAAAAKEAHSCASVNAPMAAILMARTVVEATAKAKGITSGTLFHKIDELAKQSFVRESTKEAAHEVRHFGNDMAHGDIEDPPSNDDADEVLELMSEVLNEVFQGPARTARIRAKREASA